MSENKMRSITPMNYSGDYTLTWDEEDDAKMVRLVQDLLDEGNVFFVIKEPSGIMKFLKSKKLEPVKSVFDIGDTRTVQFDSKKGGLLERVSKVDGARSVSVTHVKESGPTRETEISRDAKTIAKSHSYMVKPVVGG